MYTIIDIVEKKRWITRVGNTLTPPRINQTAMQTLSEEVNDITIFFLAFTRYFMAKGRAFEMMVADLIKQKEANQNGGAPLILRADVPRLREIAHKSLKFTRTTYILYKDMVLQQDEENVNLIRLHMKNCMKHYHALLPQLDLIAT
jgi:hypothetical protein